MADRPRMSMASMSVGTIFLSAWIAWEGFSPVATIPTQGDVPTIGHGSTHYENGQAVKLGETITRERARDLALNLAEPDAAWLRKIMGDTMLHPAEFDLDLDFIGQFGRGNFSRSSILRLQRGGKYSAACGYFLKYKYAAGYDCSTPGNHRCAGVWTRAQSRYSQCMEAQS